MTYSGWGRCGVNGWPYGYRGGMNWTWNVRSSDGAMNGLEFAWCTTAGGFDRMFTHAAPAQWSIDFSNHTGRPDDWVPPS